jgi:glyoxylase-like metal-dependent hydrolase (beta-lactamase superfamily II)
MVAVCAEFHHISGVAAAASRGLQECQLTGIVTRVPAAASKGLQDCKLAGVLLTHLHLGHYLGLAQFGKEAMDWKGLQVWYE